MRHELEPFDARSGRPGGDLTEHARRHALRPVRSQDTDCQESRVTEAITLPAHGSKKANGLTFSERDEKQAVGTTRKTFDEARFLGGGGHELRRLPQHERRFSEKGSPKNDQLLGIAYRSATNDNA